MKQNILLITADQFRHDALGFQGAFPVKTPNLDALAAGGTTFDQAYTPFPLCGPARASILTGVHACRHGVYYNGMGEDSYETLPGVLSKNGYYSIEVGKTHFFPRRKHAGFDKMFLPEDYKAIIQRKYGEKAPTIPTGEAWDDMVVRHYSKKWEGLLEIEDYPAIHFTTRAISEMEKICARRDCTGDADEPFFMWLSIQQPHSPCAPPPPFSDMYRPEDFPPPVKTEEEKATFAKPLREFARGWQALTPEIIREFRPRYFADVSLVDEQIGRVMSALEQMGLRENTIVIFTSDHGDYLGDHHQFQKAYFHDCSSRIPLIFNGPGIAAGHKVTSPVTLCDLKPTLMANCEILPTPPCDAQGNLLNDEWGASKDSASFLPALQGKEMPGDRVIFSETGIYGQGMMAKRGTEKINYYPQTQEFDWFDLAADPNELQDKGSDLSWETLPDWARTTFEKVLHYTKPMEGLGYHINGKVSPLFT